MDQPPSVRRSRKYLTVDFNELAYIESRRLPRFEEVVRKIDTRLLELERVAHQTLAGYRTRG
jgi:hypothetical protein